ncbi:MAG: gamma-glutamyl-gamma-aminobutyrate hydrolase family protein, partial [Acidimicrobiia bacterium]|nr:gamma-glutamyl-gamma-aminobutyrate hydrolase family protein [Acidimicrobiia bacterium]
SDRVLVNSIHHQAIRTPGAGLIVTGTAPDGIIEAVEPEDASWPMWAVQWHPELLGATDVPSLRLFKALVDAAR